MPNTKKRKAKETKLRTSISTSSRNIDAKFKVNPAFCGHCKEYGDTTLLPCGAQIVIEDHRRSCDACNGFRLIMDTWTLLLEPTGQVPPPITQGCANMVLRSMHATFPDVLLQDIGWDVSMPLKINNDLMGGTTTTTLSFIQAYEALDGFQKEAGLRPNHH